MASRKEKQFTKAQQASENPATNAQSEVTGGTNGGAPTNDAVTPNSGSYAAMLEQAAKLQTAYRTGAPVNLPVLRITGNDGNEPNAPRTIVERAWVSPGLLVYKWYPTLGVASTLTDPVNMAATKVYSYVRSKNSGAKNYEPVDLQLYMLSLDSVFSLYYQIARVIGLTNTFSFYNTYYPERIVRALGFDYDSFVRNRPSILATMANWAGKLTQYVMPTQMRLFADHRVMSSVIYRDGDIVQSQMYAFVQDGFWSYEQVDTVKGLKMITTADIAIDDGLIDAGHVQLTWEQTERLFNRLIESFLASSDIATMAGDVLNAYGASSVVTLPIITGDEVTLFVKDDLMLTSIMNADVVPVDPDSCAAQDYVRLTHGKQIGIKCTPGFSYTRWFNRIADIYANSKKDVNAHENCNSLLEYSANYNFFPANTRMANFVSADPSVEEKAAAMRFKVWVDESSVKYDVKALKDASVALGTKLQAAGYADAFDVPVAFEFNLAKCGTEILHSAEIESFPIPAAYVNGASIGFAVADDLTGGARNVTEWFGVPTGSPMRYKACKVHVTDSNVTASFVTGRTAFTSALMLMSYLSNFDWHHRVYLVDMSAQKTASSNNVFDTSIMPYSDNQNIALLGQENVVQFIDAALYAKFFD